MYYSFIEFIILLYTSLVVSFIWYKEYMICLIWFRKFSDVLPDFTCISAIGSLWSICVGGNIFNLLFCVSFIWNISLLKAIRVNSCYSEKAYALYKYIFPYLLFIFGYIYYQILPFFLIDYFDPSQLYLF